MVKMADKAKRILLVENCQRGMSATFAQFVYGGGAGVRMNLVSSLREAGHRLREQSFGLILLSLHLPEGGGVEMLRRMREIAGAVPVAVLLGKDEQHLADEVRALGAVATYGYGAVPVAEAVELAQTPGGASPAARQMEQAPVSAGIAGVECAPVQAQKPEEAAQLPAEPETAAEAVELNVEDAIEEVEVALDHAQGAPEPADVAGLAAEEPAEGALEVHVADVLEYGLAPAPGDGGAVEEMEQEPAIITQELPFAGADRALAAEYQGEAPREAAAESGAGARELLLELEREQAGRRELEKAMAVLEERCQELEAGQTALIEAEHVAIEREKAAREQAEERARDLEKRLSSLKDLDEAQRECHRLELMLAQVNARQGESVGRDELDAMRAEHQKHVERITANAQRLQEQFAQTAQELRDCQWRLAAAQEEAQRLRAGGADLEDAAAAVARLHVEADELRAELGNAVSRRGQLEAELARAGQGREVALLRVAQLEELVHRLHGLADRAGDADRLAQELGRLRMELKTEQAARRRIGVELRKAKSSEEKLAVLEAALKENQWLLHEQELALEEARARADEMRIAAVPPQEADGLRTEVERLRARVAQVEAEKEEISRQQMARLEELTGLYEKAQLERLELLQKLSAPGCGRGARG